MIALIFSLIPAIIAALPLLGPGFIPTHDGEYHLIRFWQFSKMLSHGYFFPRWAPDLNSGYGIPLFNFHYPFPNYVGSMFHALGLGLVDSFKLSLALGYLSAVLFCFLWLTKIFGKRAGVASTIIFSFVPYWFVDVYVRGSIGEVFAISFFLLALVCVEYGRPRFLAAAAAGLILSHNILAMIFFPVLLSYVMFRKKQLLVMLGLGLGLSAYFWIPAIAERGYVVGLTSVNYRDHFPLLVQLLMPSWGTGFSGPGFWEEMSFQIGIIPIIILFLSIWYIRREKNRSIKQLSVLFIILFAVSSILMLEPSVALWEAFLPLRYLQYPWRLLSFTPVITGFFAAYLATKLTKIWVMGGLVLLSIMVAYPYSRPVRYDSRNDTYYLTKPEFTDGTSSLGNSFSTRWTSWKRQRPKDKIEVVSGDAVLRAETVRPLKYELAINATKPSIIRVNTLYYPGWRVEVSGQKQIIEFIPDGLINFKVQSGIHRVIVFFGETPIRRLSDWISILSLLWLGGSVILRKIYPSTSPAWRDGAGFRAPKAETAEALGISPWSASP